MTDADLVRQLKELSDLQSSGAITAEEFTLAKKRLLSRDVPPSDPNPALGHPPNPANPPVDTPATPTEPPLAQPYPAAGHPAPGETVNHIDGRRNYGQIMIIAGVVLAVLGLFLYPPVTLLGIISIVGGAILLAAGSMGRPRLPPPGYPTPGYPTPGYPPPGSAGTNYRRAGWRTGYGPPPGRTGAIIAAISLFITTLAFLAMPLIVGGPFSFTGAQVAGSPRILGSGFELLGLLWLIPLAAVGGIAVAVWQIIAPARGPGRNGRGAATAVLAGVALLTYVVGLVTILAQASKLGSVASNAILSALGAGFWLGLIASVVGMIGGFIAAKGVSAPAPGYPQ